MFNIKVRRATETDYGTLVKGGSPLEWSTEKAAREWARENIEGKSSWIVSWHVSPTEKHKL